MLDYNTALDTTKYLIKEFEYIPWAPAIAELTYIGRMLEKSEGFGNFKNYMFRQLGALFKKLEFKSDESHSFMKTKLQTLVANTLCKLKYVPCVRLAMEIYESSKKCKLKINTVQATLVICGLFICNFANMRL